MTLLLLFAGAGNAPVVHVIASHLFLVRAQARRFTVKAQARRFRVPAQARRFTVKRQS